MDQALILQREGHSLQQIADELGVSKSSIFRLLKPNPEESELEEPDYDEEEAPKPTAREQFAYKATLQRANPESESHIQLERLRLELHHKREMEVLSIKRLAEETKRREVDLQEQQAANRKYLQEREAADKQAADRKQVDERIAAERREIAIQEQQAANRKHLEQRNAADKLAADRKRAEERIEEEKQAAIKAKCVALMVKYHHLVAAFESQVEDAEWEADDWEKFQEDCGQVMDEIEAFTRTLRDVPFRKLAAYVNIEWLQTTAGQLLKNHSRRFFASDTIKTSIDDDEKELLEEMKEVKRFKQMAEQE